MPIQFRGTHSVSRLERRGIRLNPLYVNPKSISPIGLIFVKPINQESLIPQWEFLILMEGMAMFLILIEI